jgi:3-oxoacyl-[acyl-carrier-protein] synthase-3
MIYSRIIGTGSYLPKKIVTNDELAKTIETTDEWIVERTGIQSRRIAESYENASSMGALAATQALEMAGIQVTDIDMIIVATTTADKIFPSTACIIQDKLGIHDKPAFDINAACTGFNYALAIADQCIKTKFIKTALLIGTEVMSRLVDWTDRTTCVLFGDGAGAVILSASEKPGIISTHIHADGSYGDLLFVPTTLTRETKLVHAPKVQMRGNEVFKIAVAKLGQTVLNTLKANNIQKEDIDWLIPHQANKRIIAAVAKRLELPMEKVILTVQEHGNTSAASVPIALDTGIKDGRIVPGQLLLLESFGGGLTWGSALIRL